MILVDYREGSKQLAKSLIRAGLPVEEGVTLPAGDVYFVGRGIGGAPVSIGIEHKTIGDVVNSLRSKRLQGQQLVGMRGVDPGERPLYDFSWLLIEGDPTYDRFGRLMRRAGARAFTLLPGGMTIAELHKRILVLHLAGGLNPVYMRTRRDTVHWIEALYRVWTDKDFDEHKSHLGIYTPPPLGKPSQFRKTVETMPGVGSRIVQVAKQRFGSIRRAFTAGPRAWATLETVDKKGKTRKFGMSAAQKVEDALTKEDGS